MEGGLSARALRALRAVLHEKAGTDLAEMPDPALVTNHFSLVELACQPNCGRITLVEIQNWAQSLGHELKKRR
jgi:hypothetical protein